MTLLEIFLIGLVVGLIVKYNDIKNYSIECVKLSNKSMTVVDDFLKDFNKTVSGLKKVKKGTKKNK